MEADLALRGEYLTENTLKQDLLVRKVFKNNKKTERQKDRKAGRQKGRKAEKQKYRKKKKDIKGKVEGFGRSQRKMM
jgi:hypothetical protein